jgi:endoglycosylceramidase
MILHGVNMVYKRPPYYPSAAGFSDDDAAFLERNGFNAVRLGIIYKGVEPSPGGYDDAYLNQIAGTEALLARHGIFSQLDFHQDLFNERFQGEGWPDWAVQDDGLPNQPQVGFPGNYLVMPGLNRAFDHFWANDPGPGGIGLQDRYAAAWGHVAARFAQNQHTLGFDLLNEPWPGSAFPTCANTSGCPGFDTQVLAPFYRRVIARIRAADPQKLIWYEPNVVFNFGADTNLPALGDPAAGFSFHVYCLSGLVPMAGNPGCDQLDELVFQNADRHASASSDALMLSEFGATDDLSTIRRNIGQADAHMVSWEYWHYCECADPTTSGSGVQAVVVDPNQPPTGSNVKEAKLDVLSHPYPQLVAGTPQSYGYDPSSRRFHLAFSTKGPSGKRFNARLVGSKKKRKHRGHAKQARKRKKKRGRRGPLVSRTPVSEIFLGQSRYPGGYSVHAEGGGIVSGPNASVLQVVACPGRDTVDLTVLPPKGDDRSDCRVAPAKKKRKGRHKKKRR